MKIRHMILRKILLVFTAVCLLAAIPLQTNAEAFGPRYDSQKAVSYAAAHWNDGIGVCDVFVKACLKAGGVEILAGGVDPLKDALLDAKLGTASTLTISQDGVHALKSQNPHIQAGDILFFYCQTCQKSVHTAIIGGYDENGYLYTYGHNPGWDRVNWLGNFTHTLDNGQQHRKCYQYIVVSMDRNNYSHTHNFTSGYYEDAHPHKMYAQCTCSAKYYLGWNATVSSCTSCNPPSSDVPIVTATSDGSTISLSWTTVQDALEYQVWRARSQTGTYFNIYSAMGTRMVNKSVTAGETYYYKVVAVLQKDGYGTPTKTVSSSIVSCSLNQSGPAAPVAPVLTGKLSGTTKAVISWQAVSGAAKYEVWRSTSENGTYSKLITTTKLAGTNTPKPGTYYYKVRTVGADGQVGAFSNIVCITIPGDTPAPGGAPVLTGKLSGTTKAVISWQAVSGATKYEVWRSTSENGTYTRLITTTKLTGTNTPKPGTYYYKVRTVGADGQVGAFSNIVCVTVP